MGMTDDLEVALSEGSTMVRVGRALFGERPPGRGEAVGLRWLSSIPMCLVGGTTLSNGRLAMASGFFKRAMVYLGLVDDEYDEYDEYEPRAPVGQRLGQRVALAAEEEDEPTSVGGHQHHPAAPSRGLPHGDTNRHPAQRRAPRVPKSPVRGCTWWRRCSSATPARSPTGSWRTNR